MAQLAWALHEEFVSEPPQEKLQHEVSAVIRHPTLRRDVGPLHSSRGSQPVHRDDLVVVGGGMKGKGTMAAMVGLYSCGGQKESTRRLIPIPCKHPGEREVKG